MKTRYFVWLLVVLFCVPVFADGDRPVIPSIMTILEAVPAGIGQVAWLEENVIGRRLRVVGKWQSRGATFIDSFVTVKASEEKMPGVFAYVNAHFLNAGSIKELKNFDIMTVTGRVSAIKINEKTRRLHITMNNCVVEHHARPDLQRLAGD